MRMTSRRPKTKKEAERISASFSSAAGCAQAGRRISKRP
ncbi:hypothetical protein LHK_01897 [Laribacter hongkongensis HLHK9]|uniref:Uncharacterized protein n=1 Tax=Laribacter hongkongensis (strain HLHK9) TaxID=557598 RepID=C1D8U1_LARHH|nr:hypothetical protein LHK_01897 [Laribacter hongkongensis HLHK9]